MYSVFTAAYVKMCRDTDVQFYKKLIWLIRCIIRDKTNLSFQEHLTIESHCILETYTS